MCDALKELMKEDFEAAKHETLLKAIWRVDAPHRLHILRHGSSKNYLTNENGLLTL